tara:strand:+ start:185 stop:505 length:321 start_codon:yes stop_codon:yes gene_type:complete
MKGNEVRLGNYCREITHSKNHVVKVSKEHFEDMEDNEIDLFPITITEEGLVSLGLKKWKSKGTIYSKGILILHLRKRGWVINKRFVEPKYIHQIQNIYFAITNKEI